MEERRKNPNRRHLPANGRRSSDPQPQEVVCGQIVREAATLRTIVEALAQSMQAHRDAVRTLADSVQALTAARHKPE